VSTPAPDARSTEAPGDLEDIFVIHSSLTTRLHHEKALNGHDAFGLWCRHHGLTGRVLAGQVVKEPFRHLEIALEADATKGPELHEVHVVAERALKTSSTTRPEP